MAEKLQKEGALEELRILSPTAILGYGFPLSSFEQGMARHPHVIAVDAGSTDPGPYYLGSGESFTDRAAVKRDLKIMIPAAKEAGIPIIIGSAGGAGAASHLQLTLEIIKEILAEVHLKLKIAVINSELPKESLLSALRAGKITPLAPAEALTEEMLLASSAIVGQMGETPFIEALDQGVDLILAGRAYDPSVFAAFAIREGFDRALALHLGKILECAAIAALPGSGSDSMLGTLRHDHFIVEPLADNRRCTTLSVAAHTLYEKSDPYHLPGPGGALNLTGSKFTQIDERRVAVSGTTFDPSETYGIKLEGARKIGYRTISIAGVSDPIMVEKIEEILAAVKERVIDNFSASNFGEFHLNFNIYGRDGIALLPERADENRAPQELGIIIEACAQTQEEANAICGFARSTALHFGYEGRISTAGNLAFPFSPSDAEMGEVYQFSLYHLLEVASESALFPIEYLEIDGSQCDESM
ncbi:acyclic terpene utilization AtuA family protein [Ignatzschineria cameli]|uniref:acyclic terpene utilization AtuA family protein n=1 Tax=Ignatzschineria cameli TaxID=2182793 RepID=UPI000D613393|nr:acyclic terpene utilization AtuA family protein [Ignatzschineria cameli]PWD87377.1 3-methylaspartate ammonia-lyase [Ignatzschineria cameli]